jgi:hypothetical protein
VAEAQEAGSDVADLRFEHAATRQVIEIALISWLTG